MTDGEQAAASITGEAPNQTLNLTLPAGKSAYQLYVDGGGTLSQEAWLASLKANIGAFKFVTYDGTAENAFTTGGIGTTYSSTIDGLTAGTDTTSDIILLMNNTDGTTQPTKTFMIATQEVTPATTPATYEFIYAGDLQSAMPSNVLTEYNIVNDCTTGGADDVLSAEQGVEIDTRIVKLGGRIEKNLVWTSGYIKTDGTIASSSQSKFTQPFILKKGEKVAIYPSNNGICCIASTTSDNLTLGDTVTPIKTTVGVGKWYVYTAQSDIRIALCMTYSSGSVAITYPNNDIELLKYNNIGFFSQEIRQGTALSTQNTKCVVQKFVFPLNTSSYAKIITNRPLSENCEYRYGIYYSTTEDQVLSADLGPSLVYQNYDGTQTHGNTFVNSDNRVGVAFCIAEYNKSTNTFNDLSVSDFAGYNVWIAVDSIIEKTFDDVYGKIDDTKSKIDDTLSNIGDLSLLTTTDKSDLVSAINEVMSLIEGGGIDEELPYEIKTISETSPIVTISDDVNKHIAMFKLNTQNAKIIGKNLLDDSTYVNGKIINDSGTEVSDGGSSYFNCKIPVSNRVIKANFNIQRIYTYDVNGDFISRTSVTVYAGSKMYFDDSVYFVSFQIANTVKNTTMMAYYDGYSDTEDYEEYTEYSYRPCKGAFTVFLDGVQNVSVNMNISCRHIIHQVDTYPVYEIPEATDEYSCPFGQGSQSVPGLTYAGFLSDYFDIYLTNHADNYTVLKEKLGVDSGNTDIYGYVFAPKYYKNTVLLSGGMNACELSGFFGIAYFIKALMEHTESGMNALYNSTRFVIIPVICPASLNSSPIKYTNYVGVRINKNFDYDGSWNELTDSTKGSYADSEPETQMLKMWLSKYTPAALWIDCHSDAGSFTYTNRLLDVLASDNNIVNMMESTKNKLVDFYVNKGYISSPSSVSTRFVKTSKESYPKTISSKEVYGTSAFMIEQYLSSCTVYGSSNNVNNDSYGIKNYFTMLRAYILKVCQGGIKLID